MPEDIEKLRIGVYEKHRKALRYAFREGFVTNKIYRDIGRVSDEIARKVLRDMTERGVFRTVGKGRATKYVPVGD
jgi:predicted HTH transcriptional regulator